MTYEPITHDPGDELGNDTTTPLPPPPVGWDKPDEGASVAPLEFAASLVGAPGVQVKLARPLHAATKTKPASVGPDVVAVKRATARAFPELFSWADFDQVYNERLQTAWKAIQREYKIVPVTGNYGTGSHRLLTGRRRAGHPAEWAWDATAINLMEGEWKKIHIPPTPPIEIVWAAGINYMNRALANAARWHYFQRRAMVNLGRKPEETEYSDCSEGATEVYFWTRLVTGILVPDPNGRGYDGFGNTDTLWAFNENRQVTNGQYEVMDLALFTAHGGHVIVCIQAGDRNTSVWWSNGSEAAPNTTRIYYRPDLRGVVRPVLVPA